MCFSSERAKTHCGQRPQKILGESRRLDAKSCLERHQGRRSPLRRVGRRCAQRMRRGLRRYRHRRQGLVQRYLWSQAVLRDHRYGLSTAQVRQTGPGCLHHNRVIVIRLVCCGHRTVPHASHLMVRAVTGLARNRRAAMTGMHQTSKVTAHVTGRGGAGEREQENCQQARQHRFGSHLLNATPVHTGLMTGSPTTQNRCCGLQPDRLSPDGARRMMQDRARSICCAGVTIAASGSSSMVE